MHDAALVGRTEGLGDLCSEGGSDLRFGGPLDEIRALSVPPGTYSIAM
jgi:hypothetical protein